MAYPFASFGGFKFRKNEQAHWETDPGWVLAPTIVQQRPLGGTKDYILATAIGSYTRTFEMTMDPGRYLQLLALVNTTHDFTDWARPTPDHRQAFLSEVTLLENLFHYDSGGCITKGVRVRVSLVSQ